MRVVYHPKVYSDLSAIMGYYEEVATTALANVLSPSGCGHTIYGVLISRVFRSTFFFELSMTPFAFWWFATTRGVLPPGFVAADVRYRLNVVAQ